MVVMPKKNPLNSGNPKVLNFGIYIMAILSESVGDNRSVQRLTAQAERRRLGTRKCKYGGADFMGSNVSSKEKKCECGIKYIPSSNRQQWCSTCGVIHKKETTKKYMKDFYQRTYVRKGYNQRGDKNNNWTGGIGTYRRAVTKSDCIMCGSSKFVVVHHKDLNRYNNDVSNLECMCRSCHTRIHMKLRDAEKSNDVITTNICKV